MEDRSTAESSCLREWLQGLEKTDCTDESFFNGWIYGAYLGHIGLKAESKMGLFYPYLVPIYNVIQLTSQENSE